MKEFIVVEGARIQCEFGSTKSTFLEAPYYGCTIDEKNPILESNVNIGDFVFCTRLKQACVFDCADQTWRNRACCGTTEEHYITSASSLFCKVGGMLSIVEAGQDDVAEVDGMLIAIIK